jgi:hypothetical protein
VQGRDRRALVVVGALAAPVALVAAAWKVADDVFDLDGCDGPSDIVSGVGPGSCAPPFAASDVAAGDVSFELVAQPATEGRVATSYRFTNHTTEWRSVDSSKVTVVDSRGRAIDCYWDDSAAMAPSDPGRTQAYTCGGAPNGQGGTYTLVYDDERVDSVVVRQRIDEDCDYGT